RRVLEVREAVAVVVNAVAAHLGGRRLRHEARIGVDAHAADAGVRRTGVEVVAVGCRGAGDAAADGGDVPAAGSAGVVRAAVVAGGKVGTALRAVLRDVARAGRRTADHGRRLEAIGRTARTAPRAVLRHVARTGRRTAQGARGEEAVARARVAGPVAGLGDV